MAVLRAPLPIAYPVRTRFWKHPFTLEEHLLRVAQCQQERTLLLEAHRTVGTSLLFLGELAASWPHLERGIALYEVQQHQPLTLPPGGDAGMACCSGYSTRSQPTIERRLPKPRTYSHRVAGFFLKLER